MIGFITTLETAQAVLAGIEAAQVSRGLPYYWTVGKYPIYTGEHVGEMFLPLDDKMLATNLRGGLTPVDFPEFGQLVGVLGGLDARIDLDPQFIVAPIDLQFIVAPIDPQFIVAPIDPQFIVGPNIQL